MRVLWRIAKYPLRYKRLMFLAYLSVAAVTTFSLAIPRILGEAIDMVLASDGGGSNLGWLALAVLALSIFRGAGAFGQQYFGEAIAHRVAYDLRNAFYDHLQRLSFSYHDRQQTGNLMSKATSDVEGIRIFVQAGLIRSVYMIMLLLSVGVLMALLSWKLALYSFAFVPILIWRGSYVIAQLRRRWGYVQEEMGHMTTVLQENLAGQRVVKAFNGELYEQAKFRFRADKVATHRYEASKMEASHTSMATMFYLGATGLIVWAGGREVILGDLTVGELAQFVFYLGLLALPVRMVAWAVNAFARAVAAGTRLFEVLDEVPSVKERPDAVVLPGSQGRVRFENVFFSYGSLPPVLAGITFEVQRNQTIAILGAPGSGKSSIVHLLSRFYDVTRGRITVDGHNVQDLTLASLRANVGIVQQDVFLFTMTIRENIAYGNPTASFERIQKAAEVAQLHNFIMSLPEGYETWVGERGLTLSGGQRQLLAIARTLLLDPPILVLDDSTSSVDTETEHLIRRAMMDVATGRTTFIIAHRISTLKEADLILVLEKGLIVQRGTHQELMELPGAYRKTHDLQLRNQRPTSAASEGFPSSSRGSSQELAVGHEGESL
jgi:ATP-binding cassette subfamily B multidrug efflux pump